MPALTITEDMIKHQTIATSRHQENEFFAGLRSASRNGQAAILPPTPTEFHRIWRYLFNDFNLSMFYYEDSLIFERTRQMQSYLCRWVSSTLIDKPAGRFSFDDYTMVMMMGVINVCRIICQTVDPRWDSNSPKVDGMYVVPSHISGEDHQWHSTHGVYNIMRVTPAEVIDFGAMLRRADSNFVPTMERLYGLRIYNSHLNSLRPPIMTQPNLPAGLLERQYLTNDDREDIPSEVIISLLREKQVCGKTRNLIFELIMSEQVGSAVRSSNPFLRNS